MALGHMFLQVPVITVKLPGIGGIFGGAGNAGPLAKKQAGSIKKGISAENTDIIKEAARL